MSANVQKVGQIKFFLGVFTEAVETEIVKSNRLLTEIDSCSVVRFSVVI